MSLEDNLGLKKLADLTRDLDLNVEGVTMTPRTHFDVCMREQMDCVRNLEVRDDDVFICAYRKAGTHWVWEMVSMLLRGSTDFIREAKEVAMLELIPPDQLLQVPPPRVFNTHLPYRLLPRQALEKKSKVIYVTRNPKDIAVSAFSMVQGKRPGQVTFDDYLDFFLGIETPALANWWYITRDWERVLEEESDHPILHVSYEDIKEDPVREIRRLAAFLGVGASPQQVQDIARACHFSNMKQADSNKNNPTSQFFSKNFTMYRKGQVGDWKNWFSVANNERFDQVYAERMAGSKWSFRYTL